MKGEREYSDITWPQHMSPANRKKKERHRWIPQDGFRKDKCSNCGCIRMWDNGFQRVMYYKGSFWQSFKAPDCIDKTSKN